MTLKTPGGFPAYEENHPYMEEKDDEEKPRKRSGLPTEDTGGEESEPDFRDLSSWQLSRLAEIGRSRPHLFLEISEQHAVIDVAGIPVSPAMASIIYRFVTSPAGRGQR